MGIRAVGFGIGCAVSVATVVAAQQAMPPSRFDVVSIKQNKSGDTTSNFRVSPAGRFEFTNYKVGSFIAVAYQRFAFDQVDVVGGPDWADRDRFDITAQTGNGPPPVDASGYPAGLAAMLRQMLAERFQLTTHWEKRERAVYVLQVARPGRALGPGLKRVDAGCGTALADLASGRTSTRREGRGPDCTFGSTPNQFHGNAVTLEMFARVLGWGELDRPVIDRTGIAGSFDIDLRFRQEPGLRGGGQPAPAAPADSDAPSIFTAVEEQLGLKLVSDRAPVDVLVIDRLERPTAD